MTASAMKPALLDVHDLHVRFGAKEVVRGVHFSLAAGEKLALVGESGSGKTITALILLRLAGNAAITCQAQLLYGFRVSVLFGLALTTTGVLLGVITGAIQGFFGGKTDLAFQRFIEIWGSMPELYLLIIFSAVFAPSIALLLILLSLFGWMGLSDYVRAEFLRNRQLDYVKAARALGVSNSQIIWRHILPNSLTPVVTFLPFRMSGAILALTSLDFLGLGVPPGTPSLGELLSQGKNSIDAWWISLSTFAVLVVTLLLLTFMGDALRDALDPRKADL